MTHSNVDSRNDILNYYIKLTNFMKITGNEHLVHRTRTVGAQKARSKLSSLSIRQFHELFTDVNDELNRRIDENDAASVNLNFNDNEHGTKRNNARKKLTTLSESRFNDLVSDLILETEKRGLHKVSENIESYHNDKQETEGTLESIANISDLGLFSIEEHHADNNEVTEKLLNKAIEPANNLFGESVDKTDNKPIASEQPEEKESNIGIQKSIIMPQKVSIDWSDDEEQNAVLSSVTQTNKDGVETNKLLQHSKVVPIKASIDWSDNEGEETPTKAEPQSIMDSETPTRFLTENNDDKYESLKEENERLRQELLLSKMSKLEVSEYLSNLNVNIDMDQLKEFVDNNDGYIPINLIEKFQQTIHYFYQTISQPKSVTTKDSDDNTPLDTDLFKTIFQISKIISEITLLVDIPVFREEIVLLKAAVSQAITSVRYYSIYGDLLPKLTIHAAISDVSFALCNLIRKTKIRNDTVSFAKNVLNTVDNIPYGNIRQSNELSNSNDDDTSTPVKPLKITRTLQNHGAEDVHLSSPSLPPTGHKDRSQLDVNPFRDTENRDLDDNMPLAVPTKRNSKRLHNKQPRLDSISTSSDGKSKGQNISIIEYSKNRKLGGTLYESSSAKPPLVIDTKETLNKGSMESSLSFPNRNSSSSRRFTDKIENFGNNNSLGFRVMANEKTSKIK